MECEVFCGSEYSTRYNSHSNVACHASVVSVRLIVFDCPDFGVWPNRNKLITFFLVLVKDD